MRNHTKVTRSSPQLSAVRRVVAFGAIALVTTAGLAFPAGAVNSKPLAPASQVTLSSRVVTIKHVAFKGTYTGTIALLWSSTGVKATSVAGHGSGTYGANTVKGLGGGSAASTCDPFSGTGNLVGASGLKLSVVSSIKTQACAVNSAAPTPITVKGVAKILSGTGKFKGASGTLSFKGSFSIQATTAGSNESDSFNATITGTVTIRTIH